MKKRAASVSMFHISLLLFFLSITLSASPYETYLKNRTPIIQLNKYLSLKRKDMNINFTGGIRLIYEKSSNEEKLFYNHQVSPYLSDLSISLPYKGYIFTGSLFRLKDYSHFSETIIYDEERENIEKAIITEHSKGGIYVTSLSIKKELLHFLDAGAGISLLKENYNFDKLTYYYNDTYWNIVYSDAFNKNDIGINGSIQLSTPVISPFISFLTPRQKEKVYPLTGEAGIFLHDKKAGIVLRYETWNSIQKDSNNILQYLIFLRNKKNKYSIEYGFLRQTKLKENLSPINGFFAGTSFHGSSLDLSLCVELLFSGYNALDDFSEQIETSSLSMKLSVCYHPGFSFEKNKRH
ncbi:MAG: hypothetical protein E3J87_09620 [Candidatus Cloacimonadota bacterium]|nr:MAG: hypothetical protein E3J87_09620 [Candidatus Cloacimonadota bacterium]